MLVTGLPCLRSRGVPIWIHYGARPRHRHGVRTRSFPVDGFPHRLARYAQSPRDLLHIPMKSSTWSGGKRPLVPVQIVRLVLVKPSSCSGPNRPRVLDQRIQWLWRTLADQVGAKRRAVRDHVPWPMVSCGRCSTFLIDSPFRRILCEL